jgi:hypothetical protein
MIMPIKIPNPNGGKNKSPITSAGIAMASVAIRDLRSDHFSSLSIH